jgi:hypothetical protein
MGRLPIAVIAAALAGCAPAATPTVADPGPKPADYKASLRVYITTNFFDPYSLRDVAISKPVAGKMYDQSGWVVCLRLNAKNRMGGYAGLSDTAYLIRNDLVVGADSNADVCLTQPHTPWPEIENRGTLQK